MAQLLDDFERNVEPHLPEQVAANFKGQVRRKLHALALDSCEVMGLAPGEQMNRYAVEMRDQIHPQGRTE